jgi:histidyl-tRNA synthetase
VHFRSILEHLENLDLPYELDDALIGDDRGQHITFAVDMDGVDATVVTSLGGRYDEYFKREFRYKNSVGVSASIFFRKKGANASSFTCAVTARKPKVYFAQLGTRAKLQGLSVLDMLRSANVPVMQSFDATRFSSQLATAHAQGVSHLLIIGQREALDGTIIVRSMKNSSQVTVQMKEIPRFLKTLR